MILRKRTIAALLFSLSALSTKPNFAGGTIGERGGWVTPFGGTAALTWRDCLPALEHDEYVWPKAVRSSLQK